ncbi:hypothetical protein BDY19DRAFT_971526 [Irpex rosettiformis]|uniref:Uncharacterized protein n=1 Tax=Irpex rosettiformis TaxID=378272 RepID=A0ACB8TQU6_9APHY|nr:hypothetical protein BDY19DRAFT_971526 [Irpex rosettiformis]
MPTVEVDCFFIGISDELFSININDDCTVGQLKEDICKKFGMFLEPDQVTVYRVALDRFEDQNTVKALRELIGDKLGINPKAKISGRFENSVCVVKSQSLQVYYRILGTEQLLRSIEVDFITDIRALIREICDDLDLDRGNNLRLVKVDEASMQPPGALKVSADNGQYLLPTAKVGTYLEGASKLYVVVDVLPFVLPDGAQPSKKRKAEDDSHQEGSRKISREQAVAACANHLAPSVAAKLSELVGIQTVSHGEALFNGRPAELSGPPIFIYHPAFAMFVRNLEGEHNYVPGHMDRVHKFAVTACGLYEGKETARCDAYSTYPPFSRLDLCGSVFKEFVLTANGKRFSPDGGFSVQLALKDASLLEVCVLFTEVKNELGQTRSDGTFQAQCDHRNLYSAPTFKHLRQVSCCPAFLVVFMGQLVMIYGAIFADRPIYQLLMQPIVIGPDYTRRSKGQDFWSAGVRRLTHVFHVLEECVGYLEEYYRGLCREGELPSPFPYGFCPPHFVTFTVPGEGCYTLEYIERLALESTQKAMFKAHLNKDDKRISTVVVKFTPTYHREAHHLLADQDLAPKLWFCDAVESVSDMFVVIMDHVNACNVKIRNHPSAIESLRRAVKLLHDKNLVFGDLREPNVLVMNDGASVMLIDFDWCAIAGEGRYICDLNPDAQWAPGMNGGGESLMYKEHDVWMFKALTGEEF